MVTAVLGALALASNTPMAALAIVGLAVLKPMWFLAAAAGWGVWSRRLGRRSRPTADDEADALRGLVAEIAAGASLRMAVDAAAARVPGLGLGRAAARARAGLGLDRVAAAMEDALAVNGRSVRVAMAMAGRTGAPSAALFAALAERAAEAGRLDRERRALTAQARLSALVVGGIPVVVGGMFVVTGRAGALWADPAGRLVLAGGAGLVLSGAAVVAWMVRSR